MSRSRRSQGTPLSPAQVFGISAAIAMTMFSTVVAAQPPALRDPTEPPPAYRAKPAGAKGSVDVFRPEHIVTVDGKPFVVWKGRRYGVGESVADGRIERLDESAVWLRRGGEVRKLPLYGGVEKSEPQAGAATSSVSPGTAKGKT